MPRRRILQRGEAIRRRDLLQDAPLPLPAESQLRDAVESSLARQTAVKPADAHPQRTVDGGI